MRLAAAAFVLLVTAGIWGATTSSAADDARRSFPQPPQDVTPVPTSVCFRTDLIEEAGKTITYQNITVTLPYGVGDYVVQPDGNAFAAVLRICSGGSLIEINALTGAEIARYVADSRGNAIVDRIKAGVRLKGAPAPAVTVVVPAAVVVAPPAPAAPPPPAPAVIAPLPAAPAVVPAAIAPASNAAAFGIRPPSTGDAGLR